MSKEKIQKLEEYYNSWQDQIQAGDIINCLWKLGESLAIIKKQEAQMREVFIGLEKELRLHEILNCDRSNKNQDQNHRIISCATSLKLVLIREKFMKFKQQFNV
jgi:hypothetical protein